MFKYLFLFLTMWFGIELEFQPCYRIFYLEKTKEKLMRERYYVRQDVRNKNTPQKGGFSEWSNNEKLNQKIEICRFCMFLNRLELNSNAKHIIFKKKITPQNVAFFRIRGIILGLSAGQGGLSVR